MRPAGRRYVEVPFIRLTGRWLEDAGFIPGGAIRVEVDFGRLTISTLDETGQPTEPGVNPHEFPFMSNVGKEKKP